MNSLESRNDNSRAWARFLAGAGVGAACMYLIDPNSGARRRALLRDNATHVAHKTADGLDAARRDIAHRAYGTWASTRARFASSEVPDSVLLQRVRTRLGRHVSHPRAIDVEVNAGCVTLRGPILAREVEPLLAAVNRIPGVCGIDNRLEAHETADGIPALQGGKPRRGDVPDLLQSNWSPATRAIVGSLGSALAAYGSRQRNLAGALASVAGAGFLLRAATNLESRRLIGVGAGRRAVDIQKTIHIGAPVECVFDFWTHPENFPHFMRNVLDVERTRVEGHYHWRVSGPAHVPIDFDAAITRFEPNRVLAWKTVPGSAVEHAGVIYFEPDEKGGTRVHIQFSYNPPAGAIGHAIAALLGADPKTQMDEDLARVKTMIETGHPPRDAARPLPRSPEARM